MAGKKLLVVDDSLTIQKVIRLALSNEGYEIQATSDGNDALQQISLFQPDVVLIDISLPNRSAFEIKNEVNQQPDLEKIRFVLMSSAFEQVDEVKASQAGFDARLIKPFDPAHLRKVLIDALADKSPAPIHSEETPPPVYDEGSDIRQLTESTIKMSGLDEMQWSVNESAKKTTSFRTFDEPALEPPSQLADLGGAQFKFDPDETPSKIERYGDLPITPPPRAETQSAKTELTAVSNEEVEEAVRKHLEGTLERMAQKLLPEIAEKVIRQEIHKMLSQQP